jgi:flagellar motility protein MotE (MotC chaperone)
MGRLMVLGLALLAIGLPADAECRPNAPTSSPAQGPKTEVAKAPATAPVGETTRSSGLLSPSTFVAPPSLSSRALRDELEAAWKRRGDETATLQKERAELEKLKGEIAQARKSLREETARLEDLVKNPAAAASLPRSSSGGGSRVAAPTTGAGAAKKPPAPVAKLTGMVGSMKPEQAAALLARLERNLAVQVLRTLSPSQAGAVLARLPVEISADLATRVVRTDAGGRQ